MTVSGLRCEICRQREGRLLGHGSFYACEVCIPSLRDPTATERLTQVLAGRTEIVPAYLRRAEGLSLLFLQLYAFALTKASGRNLLRASGDTLCPVCRELYMNHPEGDIPTSRLICDGSYAKL